MKYLTAVVLLLSVHYAMSQAYVRGHIAAQAGGPIFLATVCMQTKQNQATTTDIDGNFTIRYTNKSDTLYVVHTGFRTKKIAVGNIDITKILYIELRAKRKTLKEVVIQAQDPISDKFAVTKVKKLDILFNPMAQADALRSISILPASTTVDESANPSLRGSAPDRSRVVLNGVPIYSPVKSSQLNSQGHFSLFSTDVIHQQYVYASNPPLTYGNTSAGLVEIQTLKNTEINKQQFTLGVGGIGYFITQKIKQEKAFIQAYANWQKFDAVIAMQAKNISPLKNLNTHDAGINYHHKFNNKIEMNSFNYYANEAYEVEYANLNYNGLAKANKKRFYTVNNLYYYSAKGSFTLNSGFNVSKQRFKYGNILSNIKIRELYLSLNYKIELLPHLDLQMGLAYDFHQNIFHDSIPEYYFAISPNASNKFTHNTIHNHIVEPYIYTDWRIGKKVSLSAAARSNIPTTKQLMYLSAQISIKYNINTHNELLLSGGTYHSYTTPNYYTKRFSLLSSQQIAVDYIYNIKNFGLKAAAYFKSEQGTQTLNSYMSMDKTESIGIEFYTECKLSKHIKLTASNLFIDQKIHLNNKKYNGNYDFNYLIKMSLQYINTKWFAASVSYITRPGKYYTPIISTIHKPGIEYILPIFDKHINSAQYEAYHKVDFTINRYTPMGNGAAIIPFLSVSNIFNTTNQSKVYYSHDYQNKSYEHYGKRIVYFGFIIEF